MSQIRHRRSLTKASFCAFLAAAVIGCSSETLIGPENQLEVANSVDAFQFQVTALNNVSQTLTYTWTITGSDATVNIAGTVTSGAAMVTITDGEGTEVFSRSLDGSSNPSTSSGVAGDWTIQVELTDVSGTLNFRVEKKI